MSPAAGADDHGCAGGWLEVDDEQGRPAPCPVCKPGLAARSWSPSRFGLEGEPPMRRERDGSLTLALPVHVCADGWAGVDAAGRPVPCRTCRPHLARRGRR